ncbi:MAG TPA: POTRA domain-containing protein, partial [Candidatus Binatia bacterium]|nr:POTRA domain-containing protein [Candidatus Binatia bacterium]
MLAGLSSFPKNSFAVLIDALDATRQWKVADIQFLGNEKFPEDSLRAVILTKERPWYRFWEDRPPFDPVTFTTDLERLRRFYEAEGYYGAAVTYDLDPDQERELLTIRIKMREGAPVIIAEIDVAVTVRETEPNPPALPDELPVKRGQVFREVEYQQAEQTLRSTFLNGGYAHVQSQRKAEVNVDEQQARLQYGVQPGPVTFFGETQVKGTQSVDPELILRELTYEAGEKYSLAKLADSREKLLALELFGAVRLAPAETAGMPVVVPMEVEVAEKPHREIRLALGYSTEDQFRTQLEWRHLNWLGGGRRLTAQLKYSSILLSGVID